MCNYVMKQIWTYIKNSIKFTSLNSKKVYLSIKSIFYLTKNYSIKTNMEKSRIYIILNYLKIILKF